MNATNECSVFTAMNPETGREINLALQELWITGRIIPVGASLQVRHIFRCSEKMPVEVVYSFGLPRDAALRRFRIVGKGFSVMSDLKPTTEAVREYEKGIEDGSLSTLARQYRDGVINLNVGNIRPDETVVVYLDILAGIEIRDDGWRFRFPFTLAPSYHSKARAIEAEPGVGEMEMPEEFGDVILPQWMKDANNLHRVGFNLEVSIKNPVAEIGSPSHAIKVRNESDGQYRVSLAPEKDVPNRDLVLDINSKEPVSTVVGGIGKDKRGHFAVVVPSTAFGNIETEARRIVFVLDRSGSMDGTPINQAKRALKACLGALSTDDEFGIVAFDDNVELLEERLIP
ncbi:MAG TPA: VIT domain-containing protein, partial [Verrucomicrobiota bacterium]|nr:VIT domain-containing protein [Verrucomicrobiota bacterium]